MTKGKGHGLDADYNNQNFSQAVFSPSHVVTLGVDQSSNVKHSNVVVPTSLAIARPTSCSIGCISSPALDEIHTVLQEVGLATARLLEQLIS